MKYKPPLVSVIIPCYNQAHFLPDALNSVLGQTYPHWEGIIIDDGSTDNTQEVAHWWAGKNSRVKYIKKQNGGLSSARNAGLAIARGDYIQLLDADDLLETDKIKIQVDLFQGIAEGIDIVVSGYRYFLDMDINKTHRLFGRFDQLPEVALDREDNRDEIIKLLTWINPMVVSAPLYRRDVFERVGYFDEDLGALEDWDFHLRCAVQGIVFQHSGYLPRSKTLIRLHGKSMSTDRRNMLKSLAAFKRKHKTNIKVVQRNELFTDGVGGAVYQIIIMLLPPILVRLVKKMLGYA